MLPAIEELREPLAALRQSGLLVCLNEFTLSAASAPYLDAGLIDRVRLAPALTAPDAGAAHDALIIASVEAARAAGIAVTVPGLTRKEQAARLLRLGCREFEGELLAPAMPFAALTQLVLAPARKAS